jgi:hypothetical protein
LRARRSITPRGCCGSLLPQRDRVDHPFGVGPLAPALLGDDCAVAAHREFADVTGDELGPEAEFFLDLGCETRSPRPIASRSAVVDRDFHGMSCRLRRFALSP